MKTIAEIRKLLAAASALAADAITQGFVHGTVEHYVQGGIFLVGGLLTYFIPNAPATTYTHDGA